MFHRFLILTLAFISIVSPSWAGVIRTIDVEGNKRVETPTIMTYIDLKVGDNITESKIEEILKNLFATGLFADVVIEEHGDRLLIKVVENKIINRIAFEGNERNSNF